MLNYFLYSLEFNIERYYRVLVGPSLLQAFLCAPWGFFCAEEYVISPIISLGSFFNLLNNLYMNLTDNQIIEIIKLRLVNENFTEPIEKITIIHKKISKYLGIRYIISTKEWADEESGMIFHKFYLNEFELLKKYNII